MSLEVLKQEISDLSREGRGELLSYLLELRLLDEDPGHAARVAEALDDTDPGRWVPWDEVRKKLDELDAAEQAA